MFVPRAHGLSAAFQLKNVRCLLDNAAPPLGSVDTGDIAGGGGGGGGA